VVDPADEVIRPGAGAPLRRAAVDTVADPADEVIAVVGMAARFPGARDVEEFWDNLCRGVESITRWDEAELLARGVDPAALADPAYVPAGAVLDDITGFDAAFFGFTPREAELMDPQHRVCLEVAWEAFERAGRDPATVEGAVGVFLGAGLSSYLVRNLLPARELVETVGGLAVLVHNDKDYLAGTVSHRLGLRGPSMAVGTACSSALVAVHLACQSLLAFESDLAVAGGVSLQVPHGTGYRHVQGGIYSADGHCRAFDAAADGTVGGSGAGVVLLRRWSDAVRDGDHVHALLLGTAVNNDGGDRSGFTAPGVDGQAAVIAEAHAVAGIDARAIGYVEAHGTGTALGDAVELAALTRAFTAGGAETGSCAIGSVKTNIGHLDAAAGVAGLIKTVLAVERAVIPASLHFRAPNPRHDLDAGPFRVVDRTRAWPEPGLRTAGVSAFGIGGTNAHAIVRSAPVTAPPPAAVRRPPLVVSAVDEPSLERAAAELARHLLAHPELGHAAVARTLAGRRPLPWRRAVVAADLRAAALALTGPGCVEGTWAGRPRPVVLDVGDARDDIDAAVLADRLAEWRDEPGFAGRVEECVAQFARHGVPATSGLAGTFVLTYAVAGVLAASGLAVAAVAGHGPGALVAAAVAGELAISDAVAAACASPATVRAREAPAVPDALVMSVRPASAPATPATVLARAWAEGADVDWDVATGDAAGTPAVRAPLPARPLRRTRFWVDAPRPAPPAPSALRPLLDRYADAAARADPVTAMPPDLRSLLDRLCAATAAAYLAAGGLRPGAEMPEPRLCAALGVLTPYDRFVRYMLEILEADGLAARSGGSWRCTGHAPDPGEAAELIATRHPRFAGLAELLVHCGDRYARGLSVPGAGVEALYPAGDGALLAGALGDRTARYRHGSRLAAVAGRLAGLLAAGRPGPLRVLEIGAGGGVLTGALCEQLRGTAAEYVATDVSPAFLTALRDGAAARGVEGFRTAVLDIRADPAAQGFAPGAHDLVVGLDVAHVAPDVRCSLGHLRGLLAPDGVLALVETVTGDRWEPMIWGLSKEWWSATDERRDGGPLMPAQRWCAALGDAGFADVQALEAGEPADTALVIGQRAAAASGTAASGMPGKRPDPREWLSVPAWRRARPPASAGPVARCLALVDGPLGDAVVALLRERGIDVVTAGPPVGDGERAAVEMITGLAGQGRAPSHLLHMWGADAPVTTSMDPDRVAERVGLGLHTVLDMVRADGALPDPALRRLLAVTSGAHDVVGGDLCHPEQAMLDAAVKVVPREYPGIAASAVDVPAGPPAAELPALAVAVVAELLAEPDEVVVAYRGRHRLRPELVPHRPARTTVTPRAGGVHLVTGGLGAIGLALGEYLACLPGKVVLVGRSPFPERASWPALAAGPGDDPVARTVRRLLAAERHGGEFLVCRADVASAPQMAAVLAATLDRFGPVTGVVHAAGVADTAGMIQRRTRAGTDAALSAKVTGTLVLDRLLDGQPLEYCVLCSSLGPVLYKLKFGEVGYLAGNEFLDAFAAHRAATGRPGTVSIAWTDWVEAGMWARARAGLARFTYAEPAGGAPSGPAADLLAGIDEAEGVTVFRTVLADAPGSRVVVSTQDIDEVLRRHAAFTTAEHRALVAGTRELDGTARPDPSPVGESVQERLALMWADVLGIAAIGPDDDFFALGGDSLVALNLLARVEREFGVDHPIAAMFERSTLRGMSDDVAAARGAATGEVVIGP
jgi:3-oxoacyl-(acyl-carrier-protein) synthase/SAM-dependent methyltransferase/acyl carrier protein